MQRIEWTIEKGKRGDLEINWEKGRSFENQGRKEAGKKSNRLEWEVVSQNGIWTWS